MESKWEREQAGRETCGRQVHDFQDCFEQGIRRGVQRLGRGSCAWMCRMYQTRLTMCFIGFDEAEGEFMSFEK